MDDPRGARITFAKAAADELRSAQQWYRREAGYEIANAFVEDVDAALKRVSGQPGRWPYLERPYRWLKTSRFPYLIVYRELDERTVLVVALAHERRAPGYWGRD